MKYIVRLLFFVLALVYPIHFCHSDAPRFSSKSLPIFLEDDLWRPLGEYLNPELQNELEQKLTHHNSIWASLINQKTMSVGLVDLSDPLAPRFASVNGDEMMYAASLPKIAILLATYDSMEKGKVKPTPQLRADLSNMIRFSDNSAATRLIDFLGLRKIESVLRDPRYKLYDPDHGGGLWVGKRYAKRGERNPDPMEGLVHAATVNQVCRFYYLLAYGRLISPERSKEMLEDLCDPGLHHKFVNVLDSIAPAAKIYRKSGTWRNWHSDSALVWEESENGRHYILVGMVEHPKGGAILEELVPVVEAVLQR